MSVSILQDMPALGRREPQFSANAQTVLRKRYLIKNDLGECVESPSELVWRVAANVAEGELNYPASQAKYAETCERFYELMASNHFMPNSPTLMNAGKGRPQQLSACFVIPVEDAIDSIFDAVKHAAIIHKTGGGTGFAFSRLRPKNDRVRSTKGVSSGPVSFMKVFNSATEAIKQGGTRRGANMGILRVDHPDILEFIHCKSDMTSVTNFNISVAMTEKFMEAVMKGDNYDLYNPKNGQPVAQLSASDIFSQMVDNAWRNGDPGLVFIDRINRDNPTPEVGPMESTNPCGEQPLLPYEACNLGSINLAKMVRQIPAEDSTIAAEGYTSTNLLQDGSAWVIDWAKLEETTKLCIRFLDDVIEMSDFPLPAITSIVKVGNRKIGLGVMGFADLLFMLGIPYTSNEAVALGERLMEFIQEKSAEASVELAEERGAFGNYAGSAFNDPNHHWYNGGVPRRNATVTTIAPTGTISIIAGCSSGIEPIFALCFFRKVLDGEELAEVHPFFEEVAKARGFYSPALLKEISLRGSVADMEELPEDVRRVFQISHDIPPVWHLEHQAAFQRHCENAVSKTVNFPNHATREDVAEVYKLAYTKGCKGVTIYRDGSRDWQVLNIGTGTKKEGESAKADSNQATVASKPPPTLTLSAGGTKIALKSSGTASGSNVRDDSGHLLRRFTAASDHPKLHRLSTESNLFLTDGNGLRVPIQFASQEGNPRHGVRLMIDAGNGNGSAAAARMAPKCPECSAPLSMEEGCQKCHACGYSKCG